MFGRRREDSGSRPRALGRILRTIALALLVAFVVGLVIGTMLRRQLERTERHIGSRLESAERIQLLASSPAPRPALGRFEGPARDPLEAHWGDQSQAERLTQATSATP